MTAGSRTHFVWRERLIAGVAAATLVLCWFLLFDGLTAGTPWLTAQRIGAAGARVVINGRGSPTLTTSLAVFSVFHYAGWIAISGLVLGVVHRARKQPTLLLAALLLTVMAYVPLVGVSTMFVAMGWGSGMWVRVMVAALIGGMTVAAQAYRAHPGLVRHEFAHIDDDG
ncbi:MAG: hypothetical protein JWM95_348 [Gemmatimonadetes bacterium]|nr:hypothetical protein [Gemmatimonadota bacterium]